MAIGGRNDLLDVHTGININGCLQPKSAHQRYVHPSFSPSYLPSFFITFEKPYKYITLHIFYLHINQTQKHTLILSELTWLAFLLFPRSLVFQLVSTSYLYSLLHLSLLISTMNLISLGVTAVVKYSTPTS
ncbi:hypothetical protein L6452_03220 [Arctium lappa]|uniref:Uncharacterized protein n=1 Tax=Arctium lappa TaxID=4217 RepID=A0ACB9FMV1_ARCLA|nr:hypothetical protein L6452_03220 [Arctium lappa]